MDELLQALLKELGSPKTFADIIISSTQPNEDTVNDLVSLILLDALDLAVTNSLNFTGTIPLKFLIQVHKTHNMKMVPISDWVELCKVLDQASLPDIERKLLLCAIGLVNTKHHTNSSKLFSIYLLDTM